MKKPLIDDSDRSLNEAPSKHNDHNFSIPLKGKPLALDASEIQAGVIAKSCVGKSKSKINIRKFSSKMQALEYAKKHEISFLQDLSNNFDFANNFLISRNLPVEVPEEKTKSFKDLYDLITSDKAVGGYGYQNDSFEGLAAMIIERIWRMLDEELEPMQRLRHAAAYGTACTLWDHYYSIQEKQINNAKKPRDQALSSIYNRLRKRKFETNLKPRELWPVFLNYLEQSEDFDQIEEKQKNPSNPESWEVSLCRVVGVKVSELEIINYKQFRNALNKKVRLSHG
jgi:hypothetical protein